MKILLIHNFYEYRGGEDFYILELKKLLETYGHNVVLYSKDNQLIRKNKIKASLAVFQGNHVNDELQNLIFSFKPQIAHIHNLNPYVSLNAYNILSSLGIPIIQTIHNFRFFCSKTTLFRDGKICELCVGKRFRFPSIFYSCYHGSKLGSTIEASAYLYHSVNEVYRKVSKYIFPSDFTRKYFEQNSGFESTKFETLQYFSAPIDIKSQIKITKKYFIYVGRLSDEKGIIELLNLFSKILNYNLKVVGTGPLVKEVYRFNRYKNIKILGFQNKQKINLLMQNAICTIIPSLWYETGPMVLIESYKNGIPVVVPKMGAFIEQVRENKTGLFYRQNDFSDLKLTLDFAISHSKEMKNMGKSAKLLFSKNYTPKKHYSKLLKIYKTVIDENSKKS